MHNENISSDNQSLDDLFIADIATFGVISQYLAAAAQDLGGMALSTIQQAAWNWEFPSTWYKHMKMVLLGGISGMSAAAHSLRWGKTRKGGQRCGWKNRGGNWQRVTLASFSLLLGCLTFRPAILFLIFYCFISMPASVYEKMVGTECIPHFS